MKHTENAASCANYCGGECDPAGTGCWHGSRATRAQTVKLYSASPTSNGSEETGESGATGDSFTDCMEGQGRDCHCRDVPDSIAEALQGVAAAVVALALFVVIFGPLLALVVSL